MKRREFLAAGTAGLIGSTVTARWWDLIKHFVS